MVAPAVAVKKVYFLPINRVNVGTNIIPNMLAACPKTR